MSEVAAVESVTEDFKLAMRELAATVTVLTTADENDKGGLTATAACSLSMDPASMIACVNRSASAYPLINKSRRLCINLLAQEQQDVANTFAGRAGVDGAARFGAAGTWTPSEGGVPMLDRAMANIVCEIDKIEQYGSHAICICRVVEVRCESGQKPLLYAGRGYDTLASMA